MGGQPYQRIQISSDGASWVDFDPPARFWRLVDDHLVGPSQAIGLRTRIELVQFVKDVLGEVREIETGRSYGLDILSNTRSLVLEFICGSHIVGNYIIPLPGEMVALAKDDDRNPYRILRAKVKTGPDALGPAMTESSPEET